MSVDYRAAINAISDVVQNRPMPIREFDQIYMKAGDMVAMAIYVADRFSGRDVAFIGDGDGIALSIVHMLEKKVIENGPASILVLDFDERIVKSILRFADHYSLEERINARLYNVAEAMPAEILRTRQAFYTNPPWGASNDGESVLAFLERGIECVVDDSLGIVVIADDPASAWTQDVLLRTQSRAAKEGFTVAEMVPAWHQYHLDDAPELRSCSVMFRRTRKTAPRPSTPLSHDRLRNFYGREAPLRYRYVREPATLNYGRAPQDTYFVEPLEEAESDQG